MQMRKELGISLLINSQTRIYTHLSLLRVPPFLVLAARSRGPAVTADYELRIKLSWGDAEIANSNALHVSTVFHLA